MAKAGLPAYVVSHPADQYYLTGFDGEDGVAVITRDRVYLITDGRFDEQADHEAPWARKIIRRKGIAEELTRLRRRHRWRKVGFQAEHLSVAQWRTFRKALRPARFVQARRIVRDLRLCKDEQEIAAIRRAVQVAEDAFRATVRQVRIGMTERQVAARLEYEMRRRGASAPSFEPIVAEGPRSSLPHARAGDRRIREGSVLLIDWGATVGHYRSDLTRVLFVRKIHPRFRRIYAAVLEAQRRAVAAVRAGTTTAAVDRAARSYLRSVGYGRQFTHSTGHGLGLDIHEAPGLGRRMPTPLQANMVVTIEPGVYEPGVGGVRIEDDVRVTADGAEVLSTLGKDLEDMVIRG